MLAIVLLTLGHIVVDMYQGAVPALLPVWKQAFALPYAATGAVMLLFNVSSSVVQPALGLEVDRLRSRYVLALALLASSAGMVAALLAPGYAALMAFVLLGGLGVALFHPEASRRVHEASGAFRAAVMSWFTLGGNVGYGLGPLAVGLLSSGGTGPVAALFGLVGLGMALVYLVVRLPDRTPQPTPAGGETLAGAQGKSASEPIPWGPLALLGAVVVLRAWTNNGVQAFLPLLLTSQGMETARAQRLISVFLLAGAAGTLVAGRAADRLGGKRVVVGSLALVVPLAWLLVWGERPWLLPVLVASGFFLISSFPVTLVMAQQLLPRHVATASGFVLGLGVGTGGMGVTLLGWVADRWGLQTALHGLVLLPLVAALAAWYLPESLRRGLPSGALAPARR